MQAVADNWFLSTWQRHAPAALVRGLPARRRRKYIRARIEGGDFTSAARLLSKGDPLPDGALWDAMDTLIEREDWQSLPALAPLVALRPAFDQAVHSALCRIATEGREAAITELSRMGTDESFGSFQRMCARAWATFLAMPRLGLPETVSSEQSGPGLMQFWDRTEVPVDISTAISNWRAVVGERHKLLHEEEAREFLRRQFGATAVDAYDLCPHPAIKADYLRLGWLAVHGGIWVDADSRMLDGFALIWPTLGDRTVLWFNTRTGHWLNGFIAAPQGSRLMLAAFQTAGQRIIKNPSGHPYGLAGPGVLTDTIVSQWRKGVLRDVANVTTSFIMANLFRQIDAAYKQEGSWQQQRGQSR